MYIIILYSDFQNGRSSVCNFSIDVGFLSIDKISIGLDICLIFTNEEIRTQHDDREHSVASGRFADPSDFSSTVWGSNREIWLVIFRLHIFWNRYWSQITYILYVDFPSRKKTSSSICIFQHFHLLFFKKLAPCIWCMEKRYRIFLMMTKKTKRGWIYKNLGIYPYWY